jgi:ketosteroid isomerase-like protein
MKNIEIIQAHYDSSAAGDLDGMVKNFSTMMRWTEAAGFPLAGTYVGTPAIIEGVFKRIQEDWADFRVDVREILDADTAIISHGTYSAKNRATSKPFKVRFVHIWRLENGQITEFEQVVDSSPVVATMPFGSRKLI